MAVEIVNPIIDLNDDRYKYYPVYNNYKLQMVSDLYNTVHYDNFKYNISIKDINDNIVDNITLIPNDSGVGTFDLSHYAREFMNQYNYIDFFTVSSPQIPFTTNTINIATTNGKSTDFSTALKVNIRENFFIKIPIKEIDVISTGGNNYTIITTFDSTASSIANYGVLDGTTLRLNMNIDTQYYFLNYIDLNNALVGTSGGDYNIAFSATIPPQYTSGLLFPLNILENAVLYNDNFREFINEDDAIDTYQFFMNSVTDDLQQDFDIRKYDLDNTNSYTGEVEPLLSDINNNYEFDIDDHYSPVVYNFTNGNPELNTLIVESNNGEFEFFADNSATYSFSQLNIGPWNLQNINQIQWQVNSGTFPIIDSDTNSYSIKRKYVSASGTTFSNTKTFKINNTCSKFEKVQILYQDKLGSFIPFTFKMMNKINKKVKRGTYRKINSNAYNYQNDIYNDTKYERGLTNINLMTDEVYEVTSDWVNQATANTLNLLFESTNVYWLKDNELYAINILDNRYESKKTINDQIINYTITFKLANKSSSKY